MAFKTTFQRLFALKIRHSFFLDGQGAIPFYDLVDAEKKRTLAAFDVRQNFSFMLTKQSEPVLKARRLKWVADEEGFFVGIEMNPLSIGVLTDIIDKPFSPFVEGENVAFSIHTNNRYFSNITNMPLATSDVLPFKYYFTNDNADNKTHPSVSERLKPFEDKLYEMGECIRLNTGEIWEATTQNSVFNTTNGTWRLFSGTFHQYVHGGDRQALPKRFRIRLEKTKVKNIVVELKDAKGKSLKKVVFTNLEPISSLDFDFSSFQTDITEGGKTRKINIPIRDGAYKLSISGDFIFKEQPVFLFDALEASDCLGIINIVHRSGLKDGFRIQNKETTLPNSIPQFDIRFQNRLTYRHFLDNNRKTIQNSFNVVNDIEFDYQGDVLTRKEADRLSRSPRRLILDSGLVLPEPVNLGLIQNKEKTQFVSEIPFFTDVHL